MKVGLGRKAVSVVFVASVTAGGLVALPATVAQAASFVTPPERLYMAPAGTLLEDLEDFATSAGVPELALVPVGELKFDGGTDIISQDVRTITVDTVDGDAGCDLTEAPYDIDDCSRIQIGPVGHGRLSLGAISTVEDGAGPGMDVHLLAHDVRIDNTYQVPSGSYTLGINGKPDDLNQILAELVYTPDPGYYYAGHNPETIHIVLEPGNGDDNIPEPTTINDSDSIDIEVRVLDINGFPDITAPGDKQAQAGVELNIPAVTPSPNIPYTGTQFSVTDDDNDEDVDGDQANPPQTEGALADGEGAEMLLVGFLDCGVPTTDNVNGFHLRGGTFQLSNNDIRTLVRDFFDFAQLPQEAQDAITVLLDGLDAIVPGLTTMPLATNNPTTYTHLFAGIGTMSVVQYALSQVSFLQPAENDTCTLYTAVSDLGNNGLPLQYVGSPPTGVEVPFFGLDIDSFDITTGDLEEITVDFDATPLFFNEGVAPDYAIAELHISPATHPEFTIKWDAVPRVTDDPPGPGVAIPNDDFTGTFNNTLTIPADATVIPIMGQPLPSPVGTNVLPDDDVEGNETFEYVLDLSPTPPPGFVIKSDTDSRTVVIVDDDDDWADVETVSDPTIVEGDSATKQLQFTIQLNQPADGNEKVTVDTVDGTATDADDDYEPIVAQTVTFAPGQMTATVNVTVTGDLDDEPDETFTLELSNATNLTLTDTSGTGTIENDDQERVLSIADAQQLEGNAGLVQIDFTVSITPAAKGTETAAAATFQVVAPNAATQGGDYGALIAEPITFAPGATTATVSVTIVPDTDPEADEDFQVVLMTPTNATLGDDIAIGTILNDDGVPSVSVDDVTVTEGDLPDTATATFTLTLSDPAIGGETVIVDAAGVTATEGTDFATSAPQQVTFLPGQTTKTVDVILNGDNDAESDEVYVLNLSLPSGLLITDSAGIGTITNDDIQISLSPTASVTEGDPAMLTLTIEPASHPPLTVGFATTANTATVGVDYLTPGSPVAVPMDAPSIALAITTLQDLRYEGSETLSASVVPLSPPNFTVRTGGLPSEVTILDDDPEPLISVADVNVVEGDTATITVSLANTSHACTATWATADGSASTVLNDYADGAGTVTFGGLPSTTITVNTNDDLDVEGPETFTVTLSEPGGDTFCDLDGKFVATVTIIDNDDPNPSLSIADASITEGTGAGTTTISFDITTSGAQSADCGYQVTLTHVTTDDDDFTAPATFIQAGTFLTTDSTVSREFVVDRDAIDEPDETFTVTLTEDGATPCDIGEGSATGTIIDDDDAPQDTTQPGVTVTLVGGDPTSAAEIDFTIQFDEDVTGFTAGDVTFGGTASPTNASLTMDDANTYTVTITGMSVSGTVTVSIAAAVAQDLAGNDNTASNEATVQWDQPVVDDTKAPAVTVTADAGTPTTMVTPITFTVEFDEDVTGFVDGDAIVTGPPGSTGSIVAVDGNTYTVSVSGMTAGGTVSVSVPAGVAQDAAQNPNTASNTASIEFIVAPGPLTLVLPANIVKNNDPGQAGAVATFTASSTGGAQPVVVVCAPASGSFFALGTTTVTCTATDADGGIDEAIVSGTFTVQVIDNEPPTIADLPDLTRTTTDATPVTVTFSLPAASDNSGAAPTVVCSPASGTAFQVGATTVTCTATDGAGLTASSSFTVTVTSTPSGPGALPPTGSSSMDIVWAATLLAVAGIGLLLAGGRRRQSNKANA